MRFGSIQFWATFGCINTHDNFTTTTSPTKITGQWSYTPIQNPDSRQSQKLGCTISCFGPALISIILPKLPLQVTSRQHQLSINTSPPYKFCTVHATRYRGIIIFHLEKGKSASVPRRVYSKTTIKTIDILFLCFYEPYSEHYLTTYPEPLRTPVQCLVRIDNLRNHMYMTFTLDTGVHIQYTHTITYTKIDA